MSLPLPAAMAVLRALSDNPIVYPLCKDTSPKPKELDKMAKVIDALVYFLPTQGKKVYAMALETGLSGNTIFVAGNDSTHFTKHAGSTPDVFINTVWTVMRAISNDPTTFVPLLMQILLTRIYARMVKRLEKRRSNYLRFKAANTAYAATLPNGLPKDLGILLWSISAIYELSSKVLTLPFKSSKQDCWKYYVAMTGFQDEYRKAKASLGPALAVRLKEHMKDLDLGDTFDLDLIRYIDKLVTPFLHAKCLLDAALKPRYRTMLQGSLTVLQVPNPVGTPSPLILSSTNLENFLSSCAGGDDDEETRSFIQAKVEAVMKTTLKEVAQANPHCECLLLDFLHENRAVYHPQAYIGISKLSCLQCGLYVAAYRNYPQRAMPDGFHTRGGHNDVIAPVLLPSSQDPEWERFSEEDILATVRRTIGYILRTEISEIKRKMSQSTSASSPSSDEGQFNFAQSLLTEDVTEFVDAMRQVAGPKPS